MSSRLVKFFNIFIEKFQYCYRDGLDGTKDMRSFSGIYFLLRIMVYFAEAISKITLKLDQHFAQGFVFTIAALLIALSRPYKKTYMNVMDTMLLTYMAIFCYIIASTSNLNHKPPNFLLLMHLMIAVPFVIIFLFIVYRMTHGMLKKHLQWPSFATECLTGLKMVGTKLYESLTFTSQNLTLSETASYGTIN